MTALPADHWGHQTSLDRVFDALERGGYAPTRRAREFKALCPVQGERTGSLNVTWKARANGGLTTLYCHSCHAEQSVIAEALGLGMVDLFDSPPPPREGDERWRVGRGPTTRAAGRRRGRLGPLPRRRTLPAVDHEHTYVDQVTYPYSDAHGSLVQVVVRRVCTHCSAKEFVQRFATPSGGLVKRKPAGFTPVLYRLPEVLAAVATGQVVWLLEGEKDVETAEGLGLAATTNTGGGGGLTPELITVLAGAHVAVVLDRDGTGWNRGITAHERLTAAGAASVRLLLPATTDPKSDFTDHVQAGHTLDELIKVDVDDVRVWAAGARVEAAYKRIVDADDEITFHLDQARERANSDPTAAEEHTKFAERWVLETELRWESIHDAAQEVARAAAGRGSTWVLEAARLAERLLDQATAAARLAHESANKPVPAAIASAAAADSATTEQVGGDAAPGEGAQVIDFPGGGDGGGGGGKSRFAPVIERRDYQLVDGRIVLVRHRGGSQTYVQILNLDLHLDGREYQDTTSDVEDEVQDVLRQHNVLDLQTGQPVIRNERTIAHYLFSYTDRRSGERVQMRVDEDRAKSGDFLDAIDVPGLEYDNTKSGKSKVVEAVRSISKDAVDHVQYRGTGWRLDPTHGWVYVTYTGLITARGVMPGHQLMQGSLARYALPRPSVDAAELRRFFLADSAGMVERFGGRVGAVLCGHAYVAPVRRNPYSVVLVGSPGSMKTGLAALAMHHFGTAWDRNRPAVSMTGNGSTLNAMRIVAHQAKDAVAFFDDVTPGGSSTAAQTRLGEVLQMLFNQEVRDRADRNGDGLRSGQVPHATGLFSSELMPRFGANARRAFIVPLQRAEIRLEDVLELDKVASRVGRATLQASMISWAARDLDRARQIVSDASATYATTLRDAGRTSEEAEAAANLWAGWSLMTTFLVDVGALTAIEQRAWLQQAHEGLHEAINASQDPDAPLNAGARLRELIASALRSGVAHLTDISSDDAPDDEGLAIRLGWRRVNLGMLDEHGRPKVRLEARGQRAGYVNPTSREVLLDSTALESMIKVAASGLSEPFTMDASTARRALHEAGVLEAQWDSHGSGRWRYTMKRRILCESSTTHPGRSAERMMTVLRLDVLLGDIDEPPASAPPAPLPPLDPAGGGAGAPPAPAAPDLSRATEDGHPQEDLMVNAAVSVLAQPADCFVCQRPARTAIDGQTAVHATCWGAVVRGDDAAVAELMGEPAEISSTTDTSAPPITGAATAEPPTVEPVLEQPAPDTSTIPSPQTPTPKTPDRVVSRRDAFTAAAVVVDVDLVHLPDGTTRPTGTVEHLGDLAQLGYDLHLGTQVTAGSRGSRGHDDPGVVVVTTELAEQLQITTRGLPRDGAERATAFAAAHTQHPSLTQALTAGWNVAAKVGTDLRGWTKLWREGQPSVYVTFTDLLPPTVRSGDAGPATIARRLGLFADLMGTTFHLSAQATGTDLMRALRTKRATEFVAHEPPGPARRLGDPDLDWCRKPVGQEQSLRYVHAYDRGGAHLAGVAGLELPVGDPVHHPDGLPFDAKLPGYWRVQIPDAADWRYPHPLYKGRTAEWDWVTTPALALAVELGYELDVSEAWVWPEHARVLDPWYKRVTAARTATDADPTDPDLPTVRNLVKELYTRSIGMMGSSAHAEGTATYYPERRHHIVAKARANLLRRVVQIGQDTGVWPLAVKIDTVLYASDEVDPLKAWPGQDQHLGRGLGQFKVEGTGLLADQLQHLDKNRWADEGKALLTAGTTTDGAE
ncbi:hypothetical protein [uncultured Cellulomonas sp.]|uniref:hypothetical protein n=1 Tax=uncultured Cellulomonas sp. TaxID=189682 RepID=UPI00260912E6|nr:hypothetical protein [uncultured Cellulomonas sp.]